MGQINQKQKDSNASDVVGNDMAKAHEEFASQIQEVAAAHENAAMKKPPHIPTEIALKIVDHVQDFKEIVPKALYKQNKVVIKPDIPQYLPPDRPPREANPDIMISYPTVDQSHWIGELEFQVYLMYPHDQGESIQIQWLQKLASGTLGYENLDTLRIVFRDLRNYEFNVHEVQSFVLALQERLARPLQFEVKTLITVIDGHCCPGNGCSYNNPIICQSHARLCNLL
ncbi:hypothetical protein EK21DRAFT_110043 [Setomelanomma holmii]|uniref:Uncharacterized protein n=1 Tax=Setomelanomma holmii TaxID=210430 RepID=A0A9P4HD62_9PLEO|nr:hypothetical protein EK21DRAFT_110043 [Setomelanomma holmii]